MNRPIHSQSCGLAASSRTAQMRDHLPTQDSTISRIFGRRQKQGEMVRGLRPGRRRGQAHGGRAIRGSFGREIT